MIAVYIVLGLVLLFFVLSAMGPRSYAVQRSQVINTPRANAYNYIRFLKNQDEWGPWAKKDPNMSHEYRGTDGQVGFVSAWKGNKDVGEGEQEITSLDENAGLESKLRFFKPWKAESDAFIHLEDVEEGTNVTWGFKGDNKTPMSRVMGLFMNMDKAIGKDFEEGLGSLKEILESKS